jgi:antitoxin VapB
MSNTRTAKLFKNGASQAVRLPAEFRFEGEEVFATRDELTGDVTLSTRPGVKAWSELFEILRKVDASEGFMAERPLNATAPASGIFDDETDSSER